MRHIATASLIVAGVIYLLPLSGLLGAERLHGLYGLTVDEPNVLMLMRHRAALFGILGGFLVTAAFRPHLMPAAFCAGFLAVAAFLGIALTSDGYNAQIATVVSVDIVALVCLALGASACAAVARRNR